MDRVRQRDIVRDALELHASGATQLADGPRRVAAAEYTARNRFAAERRALERRWSVAGLSADLRSPGDYAAVEVAGVPVLLVRHDDGTVRGFLNVCRHRAAVVARGRGRAVATFVCPFHAWTYGRDGSLLARPSAHAGFDGIDPESCGLVPCAVSERHGVVLVQPTATSPPNPPPDWGDGAAELDDLGLAGFHPVELDEGPAVWVSRWAANWKLLLDTFLESYHVFRLHRTTVGRYFLASPATWQAWPDALRFHTFQRSVLALAERPESEWALLDHASVQYVLMPDAIVSHSVDHVAFYRFVPHGVADTTVELRLYAPDPVPESGRDHYERTLELHRRVSGGEDFAQQVEIQGNLATGRVESTVFGRQEGPAIWFHDWTERHLGGE